MSLYPSRRIYGVSDYGKVPHLSFSHVSHEHFTGSHASPHGQAFKTVGRELGAGDDLQRRLNRPGGVVSRAEGRPKKMSQIKAVNNFMNKSRYIQDNKNWGKKDYWASPGEFLAKFGDCEDFSIAKYMALKYLGMVRKFRNDSDKLESLAKSCKQDRKNLSLKSEVKW